MQISQRERDRILGSGTDLYFNFGRSRNSLYYTGCREVTKCGQLIKSGESAPRSNSPVSKDACMLGHGRTCYSK